jgi:hypothetical protein
MPGLLAPRPYNESDKGSPTTCVVDDHYARVRPAKLAQQRVSGVQDVAEGDRIASEIGMSRHCVAPVGAHDVILAIARHKVQHSQGFPGMHNWILR